ncbi:MAG: DUF6776 family protein [Casimicrobiaceae bacterium]
MPLIRSDRILSSLRRRFGISAPRLSVRTHWSWRMRATVAGIALLILAGLFYSGFDAGRLVAGLNVGRIEEERKQLMAELARLRGDNERLLRENVELGNSAQMALGARDVLAKQITQLQQENTQLKEEVSFFEKLLGSAAGGGKGGLAVQRLQAERDSPTTYRLRALVVQGANEQPFKGRLTVLATVQDGPRRLTLNLPDEQPELAPALALDFKTYQRADFAFRVPAGAELKTVQVRVHAGSSNSPPRVQQTLHL